MAGKFGVCITGSPIRHALPYRQPDVDHAPVPQDAALHPRSGARPKCTMLRHERMAILLCFVARHTSDHGSGRNMKNKHQGLVIPQSSNFKSSQNTDQEQINIPRSPAKPGRCLTHDLSSRRRPLYRKNNAGM